MLCRNQLSAVLAAHSHRERFRLLLQLEEIQMEVDIRKYDLFDIGLREYKANSRLLTLEVLASLSELYCCVSLQCFDAVSCASGRASGL